MILKNKIKKLFGIVFVLIFSFLIVGSFSYKTEAAVDPLALYPKVKPTITSFSPTSGLVGDMVTIVGKDFERLDYVIFGTTKTIAQSFTGTGIKVKVPEGATNGKITVMNFSNLSIVSTQTFKILDTDIVFSDKIGSATATGITLRASGLLPDTDYKVSLYNDGETVAFKDLSIPTNSDGTFEFNVTGLVPSHRYKAVLEINIGGTIIPKEVFFDTLFDPNAPITATRASVTPSTPAPVPAPAPAPAPAPTPANNSIYKGGIIPECNTGVVDTKTGQFSNPCDFNYVMQLINNIIKFLLFTIATPLVALILMYTGYLYITAGGNSGQTEKVRHILFNAVVGYIIALAAWLIVNTIVSSLKVDTSINTFLDKSALVK